MIRQDSSDYTGSGRHVQHGCRKRSTAQSVKHEIDCRYTSSLLAAGDNITIDKDTNKISLADTITLGSDANVNNQVKVDGSNGQVVIGAADSGLVIGNQEFTLKNADGTDKLMKTVMSLNKAVNTLQALAIRLGTQIILLQTVPQRKGN